MKRFALVMLSVSLIGLAPASSFAYKYSPKPPVLRQNYERFQRETLTADAAIVIDEITGEVLFSHNSDDQHVAASLTKIVSAMIALEQRPSMWGRVRLAMTDEVGGARLRIPYESTLRMKDLFYASLTGSANNAATALMRTSGLETDYFIREMNIRAAVLGATKTRFYDPSGMDARNMTSASDMAIIARYAFRNNWIRRLTTTMRYNFTVLSSSKNKEVKNTNRLLVVDPDIYITGGKTGYLPESGYNLVVRVRENGRQVIVVTLGADTRTESFDETKALAKWAFKNYRW